MIDAGDQVGQPGARRPAQERHEPLKESEVECDAEDGSPRAGIAGGADAERDGGGVHGQGEGEQQGLEDGHGQRGILPHREERGAQVLQRLTEGGCGVMAACAAATFLDTPRPAA